MSWERVISGPGIENIYDFLRDGGRFTEPKWLRQALAAGDPPAVITASALESKSDLCAAALDMFVSAYGAEAGNLALKVMATGGVYVGGGIAPKILPKLRTGSFVRAFTAKGGRRRPHGGRISQCASSPTSTPPCSARRAAPLRSPPPRRREDRPRASAGRSAMRREGTECPP